MAPPTTTDARINDASAALKDASDKVAEQYDRASGELNKLISVINDTLSSMNNLSWLGGFGGLAAAQIYGGKVRDATERLKAIVEDVLRLVRKILDEGIPVLSLITRAFDWLDQVHAPVKAMSSTAARYTINLNNWSGPAKTAYDQRVPLQTKAIDTFANTAADVARWLADLAAANASYILSLLEPLAEIIGAFLAAAASASTIAGALEAIGQCTEAVQIAVVGMYKRLENAVGNVMEVIGKMVDAKRSMGDLGSSWPEMVTR